MKDRIKAIRKDQGLTQQKLADLFGVKRNTVAQWETGINAITNQTIEQYIKAFHVNRKWLETGEGNMYQDVTSEERIGNITNVLMDVDEESEKFDLIEKVATLDNETVHALLMLVEAIKK